MHTLLSDRDPTTVQASGIIGSPALANATESTTLSTLGFSQVYYSALIADLGDVAITVFFVQVLWSDRAVPGTYAAAPQDWQPVQADAITAGVSLVDEYTLQYVVASFAELTAGVPARVGFTVPVYGPGSMKTLIWSTDAAAGSDFTISATRRV